MKRAVLTTCLLVILSGCSRTPDVQLFPADAYPERLSDWGVVWMADGQLAFAPESLVYDLNTALFTDYALKLRTIYIPAETQATYREFEAFDFPVGSIITKTFMYGIDATGGTRLKTDWNGDPAALSKTKVVETRLLVRQPDGWDALPYIWQGEDAFLSITGDLMTLPTTTGDLNYLVPSKNQCASCHATNHTSGAIQPIGIKARHLNRAHPIFGKNQLLLWQARGQLENLPDLADIPANALSRDLAASTEHHARSYLDINCGHCHNPQGAADTSGLLLDYQNHAAGALGICKPPIAAGRGSGGFLYSIVPGEAEASILTYRMSTTDPATMMPELGRSLVHKEGLDLVSRWVDSLQGECL